MRTAYASFRLSVIDEADLVADPHPDRSVRMAVRGHFMEPVHGVDLAEIEVRLDTAQLADLMAQGRSVQLTLAQQARQSAEIVIEGTEVAFGRAPSLRADTELLELLADSLRRWPDRRPSAKDSSPGRGGP